jgi:hypothetical protein
MASDACGACFRTSSAITLAPMPVAADGLRPAAVACPVCRLQAVFGSLFARREDRRAAAKSHSDGVEHRAAISRTPRRSIACPAKDLPLSVALAKMRWAWSSVRRRCRDRPIHARLRHCQCAEG